MSRTVQCAKLKKELEAVVRPPYPGEIGIRVYQEISAEAWQMWVSHQTMLINEYRLNPVDAKARKFLEEEMEKFLFSDEETKIEGYVPPSL
jgi:Fe-S cluster biosynthesis and repair protein YggX